MDCPLILNGETPPIYKDLYPLWGGSMVICSKCNKIVYIFSERKFNA